MKTAFIALIIAFLAQTQTPEKPKPTKNDPNGIWQTSAGTKFEIKLIDSNLSVHFVEGSNPAYVKYEVSLKNTGEVNTYQGGGYFVAKVEGKECMFDTSWAIVV